jgi:hypothetical protein
VENGVGLVRAFDRDADGVIVRRWGGSAPASFEVPGWSEEIGRPAKEDYTPQVSGAAGQLQFHLVEFDGTNIVSSRPLGAVVGFRRQGAYGQEFTSGGEPELRRSFHGHREEPGLALTAAGPRHLLLADGRWLQPEPLLYLGIPEELRSDPRALMTYRYGHNAPSVYADDTGFLPQVAAGRALMTAALWGYRLYTVADTVATATDYGVAAYALWRGDVSLAQHLAFTATMGAGTPVPNGLATAKAAKRYGPEIVASAARMGDEVALAGSRAAEDAVASALRGVGELQGMANATRTAASHPAAARMRTNRGRQGGRCAILHRLSGDGWWSTSEGHRNGDRDHQAGERAPRGGDFAYEPPGDDGHRNLEARALRAGGARLRRPT